VDGWIMTAVCAWPGR